MSEQTTQEPVMGQGEQPVSAGVQAPTEPSEAQPASPEQSESDVYLSRSEVENIVSERERHFQSSFDKRVAEVQRKAQAEIEALRAQVQQQTPQTQAANVNAAIQAGFTRDQIIEALDNGSLPDIMAKIAEDRARAIADEAFEKRMQQQEQAARVNAEIANYMQTVANMQQQHGLTDADVQRIMDTTDRYAEKYGVLPSVWEAASVALGINQESVFANALQARKTPPPPPTRPAPPLIGDGGSAIPAQTKHNGPLRPGGYQGLM